MDHSIPGFLQSHDIDNVFPLFVGIAPLPTVVHRVEYRDMPAVALSAF